MPRSIVALVAAGIILLGQGGCEPITPAPKRDVARDEPAEPPLHVAGTVGEYAVLVPGGLMSLQGYGVVIALGPNGSSEVPQHLKKYFIQYLARENLGQASKGLELLSPERFLRDKDTAVVFLSAVVPPGAPAGSVFDLQVSDFPQAPTRSLDGGILMPSDMRLTWRGRAQPGGPSFVWAEAAGRLFVNPFLNFSDSADLANTRSGRVIGGLTLRRSRPAKLQLREPDYQRCRQIENRINEKFSSPGRQKIANAVDSFTIDLTIPPDLRDNYAEFLGLMLHLPLVVSGPQWEQHARQILIAMESHGVEHHELALVLEAAGPLVLPLLRPLYSSESAEGAFYAARTGLRLGDRDAASVVASFAQKSGSPLQLRAIRELGRHRNVTEAAPVLHRLLDDESELVRVAAYEALLSRRDRSHIRRLDIGGQFELHLVKSRSRNVIYATQTASPRIVLFGSQMVIPRPVFFSTSDNLVTINATADDSQLQVFRRIPRTGATSASFHVDFSVQSLIRVLGTGTDPDVQGDIHGLGLSYGQIVRVLYQMCRDRDIQAKFVLQQLPQLQRMVRQAAGEGRPDMP